MQYLSQDRTATTRGSMMHKDEERGGRRREEVDSSRLTDRQATGLAGF